MPSKHVVRVEFTAPIDDFIEIKTAAESDGRSVASFVRKAALERARALPEGPAGEQQENPIIEEIVVAETKTPGWDHATIDGNKTLCGHSVWRTRKNARFTRSWACQNCVQAVETLKADQPAVPEGGE